MLGCLLPVMALAQPRGCLSVQSLHMQEWGSSAQSYQSQLVTDVSVVSA